MSPEIIAALQQNASIPSNSPVQGRAKFVNGRFVLDDEEKPKTQGRGGFLTSLISEAGGTGGAIGGAAAGAAAGSVVPVLGTAVGGILGAGIGGFLGGAGGRVAENKIRDDRIGLDDALTEGAISGALGAAGSGFRALKGAKALKGATAVDDVAKAGSKTGNFADDLVAKSRGITAGAGKTSARKGLGVSEAKRLNEFATKIGLTKSTPKQNLEALEATRSALLQQRQDMLKTLGKVPKGTIGNIKQSVTKELAKTPGMGGVGDLTDDLAKLSKERSVKGLTKFRQNIDDLVNYNRSSASPDPKIERSYKALRRAIDGELSKLSPELKSINTTLKDIYSVEDLLQDATKRQIAGTGALKIPFLQTKLPGGTTQALQNMAGRGLQAPARAGEALGRAATGTGARVAGGMAARGIANNVVGGGQPQDDASLEEALLSLNQSPSNGMQNPMMEQPQQEQSPYSRENLMSDIQRDPENADKYLEYFTMLQEVFTPQSSSLELNNSAIQGITDLQTGLDNLSTLEQRIGQSGANSPYIGGIRSSIPWDTDAKSLRAEIDRVKQVVGKALEGGVLRKEDEEKYARILPTINDTDDVAMRKIAAIRSDLQNKLNTYFSNQQQFSGGGSLEDAIYSAQQPTYQ